MPFEWWIGEDRAYTYLGIRAEERRDGRDGTARAHRSAHALRRTKPVAISSKPNIVPVYPFKDEGMVLEDVSRILEGSGLGWPGYYGWRSRSGCYFCFYQQIGEWQGLREEHPGLFEKAKSYEKVEGGRRYSWVDGRSLDQVEAMPRRDRPTGDDPRRLRRLPSLRGRDAMAHDNPLVGFLAAYGPSASSSNLFDEFVVKASADTGCAALEIAQPPRG